MSSDLDKFISGVLAGKAALNSNQEPAVKRPGVSQFSVIAPTLKLDQVGKRSTQQSNPQAYGIVLTVFYNGVLTDIAIAGTVV